MTGSKVDRMLPFFTVLSRAFKPATNLFQIAVDMYWENKSHWECLSSTKAFHIIYDKQNDNKQLQQKIYYNIMPKQNTTTKAYNTIYLKVGVPMIICPSQGIPTRASCQKHANLGSNDEKT
jgi:hypothetical protein